MAWTAGETKTTGELITAADWNNYLGASGSLDFLYSRTWPSCRVYHNTTQSFSDNISAALTFNSERFDTDIIHDAGTPTRLTCKTAGKYFISGNITWASSPGNGAWLGIRFGGTTYIAFVSNPSETSVSISTLYDLDVDDYIELVALQNSGAQINVASNANSSPEFMMALVSL